VEGARLWLFSPARAVGRTGVSLRKEGVEGAELWLLLPTAVADVTEAVGLADVAEADVAFAGADVPGSGDSYTISETVKIFR